MDERMNDTVGGLGNLLGITWSTSDFQMDQLAGGWGWGLSQFHRVRDASRTSILPLGLEVRGSFHCTTHRDYDDYPFY